MPLLFKVLGTNLIHRSKKLKLKISCVSDGSDASPFFHGRVDPTDKEGP